MSGRGPRQNRNRIAAAAVIVVGLLGLAPSPAEAVVIGVDPGPVGTSNPTPVFDVTTGIGGVIGSTANGASHMLDFVFTDMKQLQSPIDGLNIVPYRWALLLTYTNGFTAALPPAPTAFISDENGANIGDGSGETTNYQTSFGGVTDDTVRYNALFSPGAQDIFNDVHFSLTLPNDPGAGDLVIAELAGFSDFPFVVAQSVTSVPEPGTMALLGIGLVGLGLCRRGRRRPQSFRE